MKIIGKLLICTLWLLFSVLVIIEYREIKLNDVPVTVLNFDIAILDGAVSGKRGVFYYDTGQGFNKDEVVVCDYIPTQGKAFEHYTVTLVTNKSILRLRFDPIESAGVVTIKNLVVQKYIDAIVDFSKFSIHDAKPSSIDKIIKTKDSLTVTTKGNDPHFILVDNFNFYQKKKP